LGFIKSQLLIVKENSNRPYKGKDGHQSRITLVNILRIEEKKEDG
jgi:hypothetical protein